jgi:hypothetical protein
VLLPLPAAGDPLPQRRNFGICKLAAFIRRRHSQVGIGRSDPPPQFALLRLPGNNHRAALSLCIGCFRGIQPQIGLALAGVGTVALEAMVGQDRADVSVELDRRLGGAEWDS